MSSKVLTKTKVGVQTAFSTHALAVQNIPLLNNATERLNAVMILHVHNRRLTRSLLWILKMNLLRVVAVTTEKQRLESSLLPIYSKHMQLLQYTAVRTDVNVLVVVLVLLLLI